MKYMNIDGGEVYINKERTKVITTYGEVMTLHDKEIVTARLDDDGTVVMGWIMKEAESAYALVVESNDNPEKGIVLAVYPEQVTRFGDLGVN